MTTAESPGRGAVTREALLAAAQDVFLASGYDAASIVDIVEKAGSSVGSLYHHFSGKADLWLALYESHQHALQHLAADAFQATVTAGETGVRELFVVGCRAYFDACWERRQLTQLFTYGDSPPGFGRAVQAQFDHWLASNKAQLSAGRPAPLSPTLVLALTTLARTGGQEVARQPTRAKASKVSDEFLDIMWRLYA